MKRKKAIIFSIVTIAAMFIALTTGLNIQKTYADDPAGTYARYDSSTQKLTFFTSDTSYTNGQTEGTVTYYAGFADKDLSYDEIPWAAIRGEVKTVDFETEVKPVSTQAWFADFKKLEGFEHIEKLNTSNVTSMRSMFYNCETLTSLDVTHLDTSKVTIMRTMFSGCKKLTAIDVTGFDTSIVTNMNNMFRNCFALTSLDVSHFDTSKVVDFGNMFAWCKSLTELDVSNFDTSSAKDISGMFYGFQSMKELDLTSFDTSNVETMATMFAQSDGLTSIDLTSFDTSKVQSFYAMFIWCPQLQNIYIDPAKWNVSETADTSQMFKEAHKLPGYDSTKVDGTKAVVIEEGGYLIGKISVEAAVVSGIEDKTYTGSAQTQNLEVKLNVKGTDTVLKEGTDYTVTYKDNIEVGKATVKITGKGDYCGTISLTFEIKEKEDTPGGDTPTPPADGSFPDVTHDTVVNAAYTAIYWAVDNGIVKGYPDGTFKPENVCTREQFTIMLWRSTGSPAADIESANKFSDIGEFSNATARRATAWAVEAGIIAGFDDGTFRPGEDITRAQVSVMLWRFAGKPDVETTESKFSDIGEFSANVQKAIIWAEENGIAKGYAGGTFDPNGGCQRQHMAIFLYRYDSNIAK